VVGNNTEAMTRLTPGDQVKFWGPLGSGLIPDVSDYDEIWLVGGGIGIAPLLYYQDVLGTISNWEEVIRVFWGSQTKDDVAMKLVDEENFIIATDDGSLGYHGYITDFLGDCLKAMITPRILVITCGPNVMMKKVAELCRQRKGADCYVILETVMACGLNNCKGCTIKTTKGTKSVCHDGPVFPAEEVIWDE
jgi:NAD(P)H-flavin reductase